jgi:ABC-type glutathione transport system ATPase component
VRTSSLARSSTSGDGSPRPVLAKRPGSACSTRAASCCSPRTRAGSSPNTSSGPNRCVCWPNSLLRASGRRNVQRSAIYSLGMKQRLSIGRALLYCQHVLFLDEPTRGLHPLRSRDIRALVRYLAGRGTSVFLTMLYMEEADQLLQRVAFIDAGRVVALDAPARLKIGVRRAMRAGRLRRWLRGGARAERHRRRLSPGRLTQSELTETSMVLGHGALLIAVAWRVVEWQVRDVDPSMLELRRLLARCCA